MCIALLIQYKAIQDMQTMTESLDDPTHIIRTLIKEEVDPDQGKSHHENP
jgi:hypothetical protein